MKKLLTLLILPLLFLISTAYAADPPLPTQTRPDQFSGLGCTAVIQSGGKIGTRCLNPAEQELLDKGIFRWQWSREPSCQGDLFPEFISTMEEWSRETQILLQYDPGGWNIHQNCGIKFDTLCGEGIIGCLPHGYPYDVDVELNSIMDLWSFLDSIRSVICHEVCGHAAATWNEQYASANGRIVCVVGWMDFMNCGPDSRHLFSYVERQRWARTFDPCYPQGCWGGAVRDEYGPYLWWGNVNHRARWVALFGCRPDGVGGCSSYRFINRVELNLDSNGNQGYRDVYSMLLDGEFACWNIENGANLALGRNDRCFVTP